MWAGEIPGTVAKGRTHGPKTGSREELRLAKKHGDAPTSGKLLHELEKLQIILRRYTVDPAYCADRIQRTRGQLLLEPPRIPVRKLERYILRRAHETGRDFLRRKMRGTSARRGGAGEQEVLGKRLTADEIALEHERGLVYFIMSIELPRRCCEVFLLHHYEGLNPRQIARRLSIEVETAERYVVRALKVFAHVQRDVEREGVVKRKR
jgi:RNA polymerase sigma-70 factor (ECF subfamily)